MTRKDEVNAAADQKLLWKFLRIIKAEQIWDDANNVRMLSTFPVSSISSNQINISECNIDYYDLTTILFGPCVPVSLSVQLSSFLQLRTKIRMHTDVSFWSLTSINYSVHRT